MVYIVKQVQDEIKKRFDTFEPTEEQLTVVERDDKEKPVLDAMGKKKILKEYTRD